MDDKENKDSILHRCEDSKIQRARSLIGTNKTDSGRDIDMSNKDLTVKESGYALASRSNADSSLLKELEGLSITLDRIKIPAGGGLMFEITGDDGEPEPVKEIEGIILHHHAINSFYKEKYTGGNNPPDCGSYDGKFGEGNPGGECAKCPHNQFGSGEGSGKACKNKRRIFILREGELFPFILSLPPASLKEFTNYIKRLITKGKRSHSIVTKITLKKATSSTGIQFSQAVFSMGRDLSADEMEATQPIVEHVKAISKSIALDHDVESHNEEKRVTPLN
jgi:hypothetical protein